MQGSVFSSPKLPVCSVGAADFSLCDAKIYSRDDQCRKPLPHNHSPICISTPTPTPRPTITATITTTTTATVATMLRQLLLRSKLGQTGPVLLAPSISSLRPRIPKNVFVHCTAAAPHTAIRAYARRARIIPLAQFKSEDDDGSEMRTRHAIGQILDEDPDGAKRKTLMYIFAAFSVPLALLWQFPTRMLPPVPDPPQYRHLSDTRLTLKSWLTSPLTSLGLFAFRLRRGEYVGGLQRHFAYTPLNWMGVDPHGNKERFRWWTFATHVFSHGSLFHWIGCYMGFSVVSYMLIPLYGVNRVLLVFAAGAVGSPLVVCTLANRAHGDRIRAGKGLVEQTAALETTDKLGRVYQKEVRTMQPAPGLAKIYSPTIGSSGAFMSLLSLLAIALPSKKLSVFPLPFPLSTRVLWVCLVGFDVLGAMGKLPTGGIAHGGHLAGDMIGILCYILWLRRSPPSKMIGVGQRHWF